MTRPTEPERSPHPRKHKKLWIAWRKGCSWKQTKSSLKIRKSFASKCHCHAFRKSDSRKNILIKPALPAKVMSSFTNFCLPVKSLVVSALLCANKTDALPDKITFAPADKITFTPADKITFYPCRKNYFYPCRKNNFYPCRQNNLLPLQTK